jgi:arabinan endo-1,5-alpha-L-arabinosidase
MPPTKMHVRARFAGLALALGALVLASTGTAVAASPNGNGSPGPAPAIRPVIDANFADPDILLVNGVYHVYATNSGGQHVQHRTSRDLTHWAPQPDVLPRLGAWVDTTCTFSPGGATDTCVWAPEVRAVPGGYALYYTARDTLAPRQCIGVALAASPNGPFRPVGNDPLVCPDGARGTQDLGGAIDASTYSENGRLYLLWKADGNCCEGKTAIIFIQPLSADGTTLTGPPVELIRRDQPYEGNVVEAPTLVEHNGTYYLFYSANDFGGGGYRTAYATSTTLAGPYTKATTELMTTDRFRGDVIGPGGQDVVTRPDGSTAIVFHGWDPTFSYRAMYVSDLTWSSAGVPSVAAAAPRYQAEDGVVTHAAVVPDDRASGLRKVGGMDFPDSSVTLRVTADKSGPATLGIRYDNGSTGPNGEHLLATDRVTVNGADAGVVTFAHTTWGNWQIVEHPVRLTKGVNTVTLTRLTNFAEIDSVDLYAGRPARTPAGPPANPSAGTRYEAEKGVITHAAVRSDATASAGAVVGGMDFDDSSVTLTVTAAKGGPATLGIRFANGSERGGYPIESTDTVTVNGRDAGTVTFPFTTWGNWTILEHTVVLKKGQNTVTLTHGTFFAELDAVDVH